MPRHEIRKSTQADADYIAENVRPEDRAELWAATYFTPLEVMTWGMSEGDDGALTGFVDDIPVCMWGVVHGSFIGNQGIPWMVASKAIDDKARTFLRFCRDPVMRMFSAYDWLENYVDARNIKAINWLRWLGFTIDDPAPYGMMGLPFHRFHLRKGE